MKKPSLSESQHCGKRSTQSTTTTTPTCVRRCASKTDPGGKDFLPLVVCVRERDSSHERLVLQKKEERGGLIGNPLSS